MKSITAVLKLMVAGAAFFATSLFAQTAQVIELTGTANARVVPVAAPGQAAPAAGAARSLRMGDGVNAGETISTGPQSRMTLRFEDGQIVSLTANSSFKIDSYAYNRAEPAKSNALFSLVSGGMRAITGAIGKAKPENVTYKAGNATIGVRGTDVSFAVAGGTVVVNVNTGLITFTPSTPGAAPVSVSAGAGVFQNANGTVSTGNATAVANAIQNAIRDNPMQASQLGTLAAAVVAIVPPASPLAAAVTNAVQASGNMNAQMSYNASAPTTNQVTAGATTGTGTTTTQQQTGTTTSSTAGTVGSSGSSGSGSGGGGTVPCTSVSPVRVPANCTPS
jgi:hypothetical protein